MESLFAQFLWRGEVRDARSTSKFPARESGARALYR
jgi:hypothetical protein